MRRLSKSERRRMERLAAEEFFLRRGRPPTQFRTVEGAAEPAAEPSPEPDLPPPGSVLGVEDSKEILRRLASGDIKQMRRR